MTPATWRAGPRRTGSSHDGFLTRAAFGRYLRELLADAERMAGPTATVTRITSDVVGLTYNGLHRPLRLRLAADGRIDADAAVLATGNQPPAPPCPVPASPRYICDPWVPGALDGVADGSPVVVLGTGLTMLDVAISLTGAHPETVVHAVSRHALVPREHRCPPGRAVQPPVLQVPDLSPVDLPGLIRHVRWQRPRPLTAGRPSSTRCGRTFPGCGSGCRCGISACSSATSPATGKCTATVCRPRPPGGSTSSGPRRLSALRGRVIAVTGKPTGLCVRIEQGAQVTEVAAGWLINATGPAADITATTDPLLRGLLDSGLARPDPLRLGIEADARGALLNVSGNAERQHLHSRPAATGAVVRDHRYSGDPRPGRRARGPAACRMPRPGRTTAALGLPGMAGSAA